ncbi:hypothetical protein POUND7_020727 [Theobroma cacao]
MSSLVLSFLLSMEFSVRVQLIRFHQHTKFSSTQGFKSDCLLHHWLFFFLFTAMAPHLPLALSLASNTTKVVFLFSMGEKLPKKKVPMRTKGEI